MIGIFKLELKAFFNRTLSCKKFSAKIEILRLAFTANGKRKE